MKFYVSTFYIGGGDIEFKEAEEFEDIVEALGNLEYKAKVLGKGWEVCFGKGEGDEDWYPPIK